LLVAISFLTASTQAYGGNGNAYSLRDSPRNRENDRYEGLGNYVLEPFRYFEERRDDLAYPFVSLLEDFEQSQFPLFMAGDPHWNAAGSAFMARRVARASSEHRHLPCSPS